MLPTSTSSVVSSDLMEVSHIYFDNNATDATDAPVGYRETIYLGFFDSIQGQRNVDGSIEIFISGSQPLGTHALAGDKDNLEVYA